MLTGSREPQAEGPISYSTIFSLPTNIATLNFFGLIFSQIIQVKWEKQTIQIK